MDINFTIDTYAFLVFIIIFTTGVSLIILQSTNRIKNRSIRHFCRSMLAQLEHIEISKEDYKHITKLGVEKEVKDELAFKILDMRFRRAKKKLRRGKR